MRLFLMLCCSLSLTSCSIYRASFDCPPSKGVPCTSVTEIEKMIVETDQGPDLFIPEEEEKKCEFEGLEKRCRGSKNVECHAFKKVWIPDHIDSPTRQTEGHFIYLLN